MFLTRIDKLITWLRIKSKIALLISIQGKAHFVKTSVCGYVIGILLNNISMSFAFLTPLHFCFLNKLSEHYSLFCLYLKINELCRRHHLHFATKLSCNKIAQWSYVLKLSDISLQLINKYHWIISSYLLEILKWKILTKLWKTSCIN